MPERFPVRTLLMLAALLVPAAHGQVVTTTPAFPVVHEPLTITFNAAEGDRGLVGQTGDIYIHTGVITNVSARQDGCSPGEADWRYVKTAWGANTSATRMTRTATDTYSLVLDDIRAYYGVPESEQILRLAMVFRNAQATLTGKATGSCDIFVDVFQGGVDVSVTSPSVSALQPLVLTEPTTVDITAVSVASDGDVDEMTLFIDNAAVHTSLNDTLTWPLVLTEPGRVDVRVEARKGTQTAETSFYAILVDAPTDESRPAGIVDGINHHPTDASQVTLSVYAPFKDFIHVIGDLTDWEITPALAMKRDAIRPDSVHWWITIDGLEHGREYGYQYLMDGTLRIGDPYTEKVLSPEDSFIPASIYPDLKSYPVGLTQHAVSVFQTGQADFEWTVNDFVRPPKEELVIYELLLRDFLEDHDWSTLIDTLGYLDGLGVNAIELMPPNEFEGNESWGYNPSFYFAPDKYYGPAHDLKRFVDAAHGRGMAVIMDMVLNHSFGQAPLIRQYEQNGVPTAQNPWFNTTCPHPQDGICFGQDFNHESPETRAFVDRVNAHWLTEYRMDGFRFDLTKGFTNNNSGGSYDADRIVILKRMMDRLWEVDPDAYVILEHWTGNTEERQLAEHGAMVWTNITHGFQQSAMGYASGADISGVWFGRRSWTLPQIVAYMESHDEERLMFKNITFGNTSGSYSTREVGTALDRMKMAAAFLFTVPGPKMLWQFGELGYDVGIDFNGRTGNKPIRWDYLDNPDRNGLRQAYASLIRLRRAHDVFTDAETEVSQNVGGLVKTMTLTHGSSGESVVVVGNFDVVSRTASVTLPTGGTWFDFFGLRSMEYGSASASYAWSEELEPGEFHVFMNVEPGVVPPDGLMTVRVEDGIGVPMDLELGQNWPNPFSGQTRVAFSVPRTSGVRLELYSMLGQRVAILMDEVRMAGKHELTVPAAGLSPGTYVYRLSTRDGHSVNRLMTILPR